MVRLIPCGTCATASFCGTFSRFLMHRGVLPNRGVLHGDSLALGRSTRGEDDIVTPFLGCPAVVGREL